MSQQTESFKDPFSVGQLVGMLVILTFIERNNGIPQEFIERLKTACAEKSADFLERPPEDIFLLVDSLVAEIKET